MEKHAAAVVRYDSSPESLRKAVDLCEGLKNLKTGDNVLIKPNLVAIDDTFHMPCYGVVTTTRLVEDMVVVLKDRGIEKITIGEGSVYGKNFGVPTSEVFEMLGYTELKRRYGIELIDFHKASFQEVDFDGDFLEVAEPVLSTDFLINMPVMKTHNQAMVSLGLKNLKGCISMKSRKVCHGTNEGLDGFLSRFVSKLTPELTVEDGIYGLEKGPFYHGKAVRMNVLAASRDTLSADIASAALMGFDPKEVPHIRLCAETRPEDSDPFEPDMKGVNIQDVQKRLRWDNAWREDNSGPRAWDRMGIKGIRIPKYDKTLCTGCAGFYSPILVTIMSAFRGEPFDEIEILTGKQMKPSGGSKKTLLMGNCMIRENRNHPEIQEAVLLEGCPPSMGSLVEALVECGVVCDDSAIAVYQEAISSRYKGRPEFDEAFFSASPVSSRPRGRAGEPG